VPDEPLSRSWTPEEVAEYASHIDESLPEAGTVSRVTAQSGGAGGAEHRPGHEIASESGEREPEPVPRSSHGKA
jgi:hypothetical protein